MKNCFFCFFMIFLINTTCYRRSKTIPHIKSAIPKNALLCILCPSNTQPDKLVPKIPKQPHNAYATAKSKSFTAMERKPKATATQNKAVNPKDFLLKPFDFANKILAIISNKAAHNTNKTEKEKRFANIKSPLMAICSEVH